MRSQVLRAAKNHDLTFHANIDPQLSHIAEYEGYMTGPAFDMDEDEQEQIEVATLELDRLYAIENCLLEDAFGARKRSRA